MPPSNCDPDTGPLDPEPENLTCPKCGAEMEPIESGIEGLPLEDLQLCPACYLVMWRDADGYQIRQGVPMKGGADRQM
jgi:uncharacterized protein with PIN domain